MVVAAAFTVSSCIASGQKASLEYAVPTDTYDNCRSGAGAVSGVSSLFSTGSSGVVKLGMTECELVKTLGEPSQVLRGPGLIQNTLAAAPGAPASVAPAVNPATPAAPAGPAAVRRITLVYANESGGATGYLFVQNALKEISRM